jgi:hypothetical protein
MTWRKAYTLLVVLVIIIWCMSRCDGRNCGLFWHRAASEWVAGFSTCQKQTCGMLRLALMFYSVNNRFRCEGRIERSGNVITTRGKCYRGRIASSGKKVEHGIGTKHPTNGGLVGTGYIGLSENESRETKNPHPNPSPTALASLRWFLLSLRRLR